MELNATRTNWSTYDALNISLSDLTVQVLPNSINANKNWESGWRYAIGLEHKVSDKYTLMAGYAFDEGCIPYDGGDFMVPTGDRKTYSIGARYNDDKQTVAIALGWMDVGSLSFKGGALDGYDHANTHDSFTKIASISYQRSF